MAAGKSKVTITVKGLGSFSTALSTAGERGGATVTARASALADHVRSRLRAETPRSKGEAKGKKHAADLWRIARTRTRASGAVTVEITNKAPSLSFVIKGTPAHTITARIAPVLAWTGADGLPHFARSVQHPGTRPNDFVDRVLHSEQAAIDTAIEEMLTGLLGGLGGGE